VYTPGLGGFADVFGQILDTGASIVHDVTAQRPTYNQGPVYGNPNYPNIPTSYGQSSYTTPLLLGVGALALFLFMRKK